MEEWRPGRSGVFHASQPLARPCHRPTSQGKKISTKGIHEETKKDIHEGARRTTKGHEEPRRDTKGLIKAGGNQVRSAGPRGSRLVVRGHCGSRPTGGRAASLGGGPGAGIDDGHARGRETAASSGAGSCRAAPGGNPWAGDRVAGGYGEGPGAVRGLGGAGTEFTRRGLCG